jgi:hypothetical protein
MGDDMDPKAAGRTASQTREHAKHLAATLTRTADTLETSAGLALEHAERHEQAGRSDAAAKERRAAEHARDAARRARLNAEEWLERSFQ